MRIGGPNQGFELGIRVVDSHLGFALGIRAGDSR